MTKTQCPKCGHFFDSTEAFQHQLAESLRVEREQAEKTKKAELEQFKAKADAEKEKQIAEVKTQLWAIAQQKASEKLDAQMAQLKLDAEEKDKNLNIFRQKELEYLKTQAALQSEKDAMKFEMEKTFMLKKQEIEAEVRKKEEEKIELIKKDFEQKLESQVKLIDEMKRKAEQGSMQLQGESQEVLIEQLLQASFPFDEVSEVKKGIRGADCVLTVRDELGQNCGQIIFESKRTQNFSNEWLEKLKDDQRAQGADLAVLVTQAMPKDQDRFGEREGVWVCNFAEMRSLVYALRKMLVGTHQVRASQENRADKMVVLYQYLTGNNFQQQISAIVEGFKSLKEDLDKEKRAMNRIWKEREMAIEKVIDNTIDMYGSIKGIAGKAIAPVQYLELNSNEESD